MNKIWSQCSHDKWLCGVAFRVQIGSHLDQHFTLSLAISAFIVSNSAFVLCSSFLMLSISSLSCCTRDWSSACTTVQQSRSNPSKTLLNSDIMTCFCFGSAAAQMMKQQMCCIAHKSQIVGTKHQVDVGTESYWLMECTGLSTGGSRFSQIQQNQNWPLSEVFSKSHSCLSCVILLT